MKDKRLANSSAAFYNGYINDGFYITDSRIRRKRPCSLNENEFVFSTSSCSRIGYAGQYQYQCGQHSFVLSVSFRGE